MQVAAPQVDAASLHRVVEASVATARQRAENEVRRKRGQRFGRLSLEDEEEAKTKWLRILEAKVKRLHGRERWRKGREARWRRTTNNYPGIANPRGS